jgi:hypothetical protein
MNRHFLNRVITLVAVVVVAAVMPPGLVGEGTTLPSETRTQVASALHSAPVMFIENAGQLDERARFQVRGGDRTIWLTEDAIWVTVLEQSDGATAGPDRETPPSLHAPAPQPRGGVNLKLSFPGANRYSRLEPFDRLEARVSYFVGDDAAQWRADVPAWAGVRYVDLYPGLDLEVTGEAGRWSSRLACKANCQFALQDVRLQVEGAEDLAVDGDYLHLTTAAGDFILPLLQGAGAALAPPTVAGNQVARPFAALTPDPPFAAAAPGSDVDDLLYATFLGASSGEYGLGIAVDGSGAAYVTGDTNSADFPTTPWAFDETYNGGGDAFVVKLDAAGTALAYATFLGGSVNDYGTGIAVDGSGAAYVTGDTNSADFPTTLGTFDETHNGGDDAFVVKLATRPVLDINYATGAPGSYFTLNGNNFPANDTAIVSVNGVELGTVSPI